MNMKRFTEFFKRSKTEVGKIIVSNELKLKQEYNTNKHVVDFLDYYCSLEESPGFAILLKGAWGSGKTWFIKKYIDDRVLENRFLYVSLYGINNFEELNYAIYCSMHPVLSSKGMKILSKIGKGLLKATTKIDLDGDGKDDGSISSQIPDINLAEFANNPKGYILVFDDTERCTMKMESLLGYINYFVEHCDSKVILIGDEDKIINKEEGNIDSEFKFKSIKEKLIGKTFEIKSDTKEALSAFIQKSEHDTYKEFLNEYSEIIINIYNLSNYNNLRNLRHVLWDFERVYSSLEEKERNKKDIVARILVEILCLGIEIRQGVNGGCIFF
jgi:hypothetical protein